MKDHVMESRILSVYELEGPITEVSATLLRLLPEYYEAIGPKLTVVLSSSWGDPYYEYELSWWRPMTEKELEKAKARRKAEDRKKREKEKKEAAEREQYEQLKAKYEKEEA